MYQSSVVSGCCCSYLLHNWLICDTMGSTWSSWSAALMTLLRNYNSSWSWFWGCSFDCCWFHWLSWLFYWLSWWFYWLSWCSYCISKWV